MLAAALGNIPLQEWKLPEGNVFNWLLDILNMLSLHVGPEVCKSLKAHA